MRRGLCDRCYRRWVRDSCAGRESCSVADCAEPRAARGWCAKHYQRWQKHGDPMFLKPVGGTCKIDGCDGAVSGHGWCRHHYSKWRKYGDPLRVPPTAEQRFWTHVDKDGPVPGYAPHLGKCWLWTGAKNNGGYGKNFGRGAHIFSYEYVVGPVPDGLTLDHLCRARHCVNPSHLEPVTMRENLRRGDGIGSRNSRKTHCPAGHEYDLLNTIWNSAGRRVCRQCRIDKGWLKAA